MTTSGTTRDNEWQRSTASENKLPRGTTIDNEWERVVVLASFPFSRIREEPTSMHPKETLWAVRRILKRDYWIKSRNNPLRRNFNRKKQESRRFSCLWYKQLKNFRRYYDTNNLVISSLVGSGHPDKYSYEIPHEYLSVWGNLSGKIISIKGNHYFHLVIFVFKWWFRFSHI